MVTYLSFYKDRFSIFWQRSSEGLWMWSSGYVFCSPAMTSTLPFARSLFSRRPGVILPLAKATAVALGSHPRWDSDPGRWPSVSLAHHRRPHGDFVTTAWNVPCPGSIPYFSQNSSSRPVPDDQSSHIPIFCLVVSHCDLGAVSASHPLGLL